VCAHTFVVTTRTIPAERVESHDPNYKGNLAEAEIAAAALRAGIAVLKPVGGHTRYDLVLDVGRRLLRVQVK